MNTSETAVDPVIPQAPNTLEESGLNVDLVTQLVLKTLHFAGTLTGVELAQRLGVQFPVLEPSLDQLKWQSHCEIVGAAAVGAPSYKYRITDAGRVRATIFLRDNHYVGKAPVPLTQYRAYMEAFRSRAQLHVSPEKVRHAFSHLVLSDRVLDQLGPAVCAGHSLFVYGPPGNGKTVIAEAIGNLLEGELAVPHALEVEERSSALYDPVSHEPAGGPSADADALDQGRGPDQR
jgi:predicted ATPase with chaperone activity